MAPTDRSIEAAYQRATECTLALWEATPSIGARREPEYVDGPLVLTSGDLLGEHPPVRELHTELCEATQGDALADPNPPDSLHFTFLAFSVQRFAGLEGLPLLDELRSIFARHCEGHVFRLTDLRLVALPRALLLAGLPDVESQERRTAFALDLLQSSLGKPLRARYPDGVIPPLFWHSTLLRYSADCLPRGLREFFLSRQHLRYGEVTLPIRLLATSYNWRQRFFLDGGIPG